MICQFCKQDVDNPCRNTEQVQQRAEDHVDRCENALKKSDDRTSAKDA